MLWVIPSHHSHTCLSVLGRSWSWLEIVARTYMSSESRHVICNSPSEVTKNLTHLSRQPLPVEVRHNICKESTCTHVLYSWHFPQVSYHTSTKVCWQRRPSPSNYLIITPTHTHTHTLTGTWQKYSGVHDMGMFVAPVFKMSVYCDRRHYGHNTFVCAAYYIP